MSESPETRTVRLSVPAEDTFLDLIRHGVGRAARVGNFTFDGIEDVVLAVNEATVLLLETSPSQLDVEVAFRDEELHIALEAEAARSGALPDAEGDLRWQVLTALCDKVRLRQGGLELIHRRR